MTTKRTDLSVERMRSQPSVPANSASAARLRRAKIDSIAEIAARAAEEVDKDARFPLEAVTALREANLLGLSSFSDNSRNSISMIAEECFRLGRSCGSTALIYAMHNIQAACIKRHSGFNDASVFAPLKRHDMLLGSCTSTKIGTLDKVKITGDYFQISKIVNAISYPEEADAVLIMSHSRVDLEPEHFLAVVFQGSYTFSPQNQWNALGMRGTVSAGGTFVGQGTKTCIFRDSHEVVNRETALPVAHILLSSVWAGIAVEAVHRARVICTRRYKDVAPYRLVRATALVRCIQSLIKAAIVDFKYNERSGRDGGNDFESAMNQLKTDVSDMSCEAVFSAMSAGGLDAYRQGTQWSIGRLLRDIVSAPIMINNAVIQSKESKKIFDESNEKNPFIHLIDDI